MIYPQEMKNALESARSGLNASINGELPLPLRKTIWASFGPREVHGARATRTPAHQKRTYLAILAVEKVLPLWSSALPDNEEPSILLATAREYIREGITYEDAWKRKNRSWGDMEKLTETPAGQSTSIAVGFAAVCAVTTALNDEVFGVTELDDLRSDRELDPYEWDASFYASIAYAGGASWESQSSAQKRRAFWEWYLNEGVPIAVASK